MHSVRVPMWQTQSVGPVRTAQLQQTKPWISTVRKQSRHYAYNPRTQMGRRNVNTRLTRNTTAQQTKRHTTITCIGHRKRSETLCISSLSRFFNLETSAEFRSMLCCTTQHTIRYNTQQYKTSASHCYYQCYSLIGDLPEYEIAKK